MSECFGGRRVGVDCPFGEKGGKEPKGKGVRRVESDDIFAWLFRELRAQRETLENLQNGLELELAGGHDDEDAPVGIRYEVLNQIAKKFIREEDAENDCVICLQACQAGNLMRKLQCDHEFHST